MSWRNEDGEDGTSFESDYEEDNPFDSDDEVEVEITEEDVHTCGVCHRPIMKCSCNDDGTISIPGEYE